MSELKLPAASGGGSISIKGPASSSSDVDLLDTSGNLKLSDNDELRLGTGDDLKFHHNGTSTYLNNNTGDLYLKCNSNDIYLQSVNDIFIRPEAGENGIKVIGNGAVEIYHDNAKKLETTSAGGTLTGNWTGKVGLQEADQWRQISSTSGSSVNFLNNWERVDTDSFNQLGTGMSQSAGIWSFPSTGVWLIDFTAQCYHTDYDRRYIYCGILTSTNDTNYVKVAEGYSNLTDLNSDAHYASATISYLFDVTDTSNCKFYVQGIADGSVTWLGSTTLNKTTLTCIRLGDT